MPDNQGADEAEGGKHGGARQMADAAAQAEAEGDDAKAEVLMDQALRTDPEGLANALAQDKDGLPLAADEGAPDDEAVAAISRELKRHADSPSRAGISGSGSGADTM